MNNNNNNYNKPIKISKYDIISKSPRRFEKQTIKEVYGNLKNKFTNVIVYVTREEGDKLNEFRRYCSLFKCANIIYCNTVMEIDTFRSNNNINGLEFTCQKCKCNGSDIFKESKDYAIWFNTILDRYGLSFKDGIPKLIICKPGDGSVEEWNIE